MVRVTHEAPHGVLHLDHRPASLSPENPKCWYPREAAWPFHMQWALNRQPSRQVLPTLPASFFFVLEPLRASSVFPLLHPHRHQRTPLWKCKWKCGHLVCMCKLGKNGKRGRGVGFLDVPMTALVWTPIPTNAECGEGAIDGATQPPSALLQRDTFLKSCIQMERWSVGWCWRFHGPRGSLRPGALTGCLLCSRGLSLWLIW